jgi:putative heme-binding domain-containing protein
MRPSLRSFTLLAGLLASTLAVFADAQLTLQDGDRVLLIGDVLIERENNFGYLETKMRREFPGRNFAVRNLGYSGDSPLGASRASFDPVAKGVDSLKEQLAVVKPTVAILGYGMAASLDELTYRKNDPVLNPDPARYGTDHSPAKFRRELLQLMDLITAASPGGKVRFVFVGPIKHEDLRASRPGLPDPAEHNAILAEYEKVLRDLAAEKHAPFIAAEWQKTAGISLAHGTDNGVHLNARGYRALATSFAQQLGWKVDVSQWDAEDAAQASLREAILRKNALFFHRSRPANYTYIFGFRRGEQGRNAVEIPKFDPLVDKAEANAIGISAGKPSTLPPQPKTPSKLAELPPLPRPDFKLEPGLEITLFAENPLLEKPVHMNWDTRGRLWVATSNTYPQVNPDDLGAQMEGNASKFGPSTGNDKIILIEDTNKDGVAESSRIIADKLLIPAGVAPDNRGGCFVGASTELLHLTKPDADGLLSDRRIVFSGFGTEDTHHIIHALHWGIDGRLYFHQTIYIHSHIETPWGLIRANSGVAFAYDPERERLEVHSKGLVNAWGQQEDLAGQTFLTSGADGNGVSWGFPGAVLPPSEGARRTISSISPGSYPKFCGLEIVHSPLFGADWQGNAITNDFRAHRIVRFAFNDFTADAQPKSGYITKTQPDVVRTSDASFRPIGLSMGPDGGLYVADWTNPIINHGEVDFRDPRRDKQHGRIWRIAPAGSKPLAWTPLAGQPPSALLAKLTSPNRWEFEQARRELLLLDASTLQQALKGWAKDEVTRRHAAWLLSGRTDSAAELLAMLKSSDAVTVQVALRELGKANRLVQASDVPAIAATLQHANPRVQLEAYRALARLGTFAAADAVLDGATNHADDSFLDFAAWTSVNEVAQTWLSAVVAQPDLLNGREAKLDRLVKIADPVVSGPHIQALFKGRTIDAAGSGPWIELIGKAGGETELAQLFSLLTKANALQPAARVRAAGALVDAALTRNARPAGDLAALGSLFQSDNRDLRLAAIRLSGAWKLVANVPAIAQFAGQEKDPAARDFAFKALRDIGQPATVKALQALAAETQPLSVRRGALIGLSVHAPAEALKVLPAIFAQLKKNEAVSTWQELFTNAAFSARLVKAFPKDLSPETYAAALQAAKGSGRTGKALVDVLTPLTGAKAGTRDYAAEVNGMVAALKRGADPVEGEIVYRKNGCALCHAIGGAGGKLGPDLSSIGASAPIDYIVESVLNPAAKVKEGYHGFAFTMKDGSVLTGIPARETTSDIIIRPGPGVELPVSKANLVKRENIGSLMPAGLVDGLEFVPKRSLFAFLGEIGKPGPFDTSKNNVARAWTFQDQPPGALAKSGAPATVYSLINGQLLKEFNPGRLYAEARFTASAATAKPLLLTGVKAAWIDGKPVELKDGKSTVAAAAGNHVLVVEPDLTAPFFKAQWDDVTFLGD